jgi:hypothetical protein
MHIFYTLIADFQKEIRAEKSRDRDSMREKQAESFNRLGLACLWLANC